jgi:hypothetical protein
MLYQSTRKNLEDQIAKDLLPASANLSQEEIDAVILAMIYCMQEGYGEMTPLFTKYSRFLCGYCGRLHKDPDCYGKWAESIMKDPPPFE